MRFRPLAVALQVGLVTGALAAHAERVEPAAEQGKNFEAELKLLYRVVACAENGVEVPEEWTKVVERHCAELAAHKKRFRARYVDKAMPFIAKLRPADLPEDVVYPFGGGDLASALVTYPDATEITTMSLEHAGDPTRLGALAPWQLQRSLGDFRAAIRGLMTLHDSSSVNLQKMQRGPLPGQVVFFLTALSVFGYQPVSLRYFRLEADGSIRYHSEADIAALASTTAKKKKSTWENTDHSVAFSNVELTFRRAEGGPLVVHRHIAANLDDRHFAGSPVERHLASKGEVAAMTKAASYLLWNGNFSLIRAYLSASAVFMVSDSTGIPPSHARKAGLSQVTYGKFTGAFLKANAQHGNAFVKLWSAQPFRKVPFRYGYPDRVGNFHLLVTHRQAP
ncbi:MAG TPA: hypothetical protein VFU21_25145 [Kofleriaceae bacterium]|nr:hypothetical protein [Kofleriaceae bacterium]